MNGCHAILRVLLGNQCVNKITWWDTPSSSHTKECNKGVTMGLLQRLWIKYLLPRGEKILFNSIKSGTTNSLSNKVILWWKLQNQFNQFLQLVTEHISQTEYTKEVSMFEVLSFLNFFTFVSNNINDTATMNIDVEQLKSDSKLWNNVPGHQFQLWPFKL